MNLFAHIVKANKNMELCRELPSGKPHTATGKSCLSGQHFGFRKIITGGNTSGFVHILLCNIIYMLASMQQDLVAVVVKLPLLVTSCASQMLQRSGQRA